MNRRTFLASFAVVPFAQAELPPARDISKYRVMNCATLQSRALSAHASNVVGVGTPLFWTKDGKLTP